MPTIQPQGDNLRKATKWISDELQSGNETSIATLIEQASRDHNLSPAEEEYLFRTHRKKGV